MTPSSELLPRLRESGFLPRHAVLGEWRCAEPIQATTLAGHCTHWFGTAAPGDTPASLPLHPRITWLDPETGFEALPDGALDLLYTCAPVAEWNRPALLADFLRVLQPGGSFLVLPPESDAPPPAPPAAMLALRGAGFAEFGPVGPDTGRPRILRATKAAGLFVTPAAPMVRPEHRKTGYALLSGEGLEIGALDAPAEVPAGCRVVYFDAIDTATARQLFPEANAATLVKVDQVGDLDRDGLATFEDGRFSFVICNHVLEHVANPLRAVRELFRVVRPGGHVVVAIPDMRYTFDHDRPLTSFAHVWSDYEAEVTENSDDHYIEFIRHVVPHVLAQSPERQALHLQRCRQRREHAHVWTSATFRAHLDQALPQMGVRARLVFSSNGEENRLECFLVWEKL